jgi:hypothetical protein
MVHEPCKIYLCKKSAPKGQHDESIVKYPDYRRERRVVIRGEGGRDWGREER